MSKQIKLNDGDQCTVVAGTHKGKSGTVSDINTSKTGHITITVTQKDGVRFKTLGKNVVTVPGKTGKAVKKDNAHDETLLLYQKLVATNKKAELKGKTLPYTAYNGNMFSALYQDGTVGIRLPEEERAAFIKKYKSAQPVQHGVTLKEYVLMPVALLRKTTEAKKYFDKSFEYVKNLKPKK